VQVVVQVVEVRLVFQDAGDALRDGLAVGVIVVDGTLAQVEVVRVLSKRSKVRASHDQGPPITRRRQAHPGERSGALHQRQQVNRRRQPAVCLAVNDAVSVLRIPHHVDDRRAGDVATAPDDLAVLVRDPGQVVKGCKNNKAVDVSPRPCKPPGRVKNKASCAFDTLL
jgi:hypothetical protein